MNEVSMLARYSLMIIVGSLVSRGYIDGSLTEPILGLGVAIITYAWKKYEDHKKKIKEVK